MKSLSYIYRPLLQIFDYRSRMGRREFWVWSGVVFTLLFLHVDSGLTTFSTIWAFFDTRWPGLIPVWVRILSDWLPPIVLLLTCFSAMNRRVRDTGKNPHLLWLNLVNVAVIALAFSNWLALLALPFTGLALFTFNCYLLAKPSAEGSPHPEGVTLATDSQTSS